MNNWLVWQYSNCFPFVTKLFLRFQPDEVSWISLEKSRNLRHNFLSRIMVDWIWQMFWIARRIISSGKSNKIESRILEVAPVSVITTTISSIQLHLAEPVDPDERFTVECSPQSPYFRELGQHGRLLSYLNRAAGFANLKQGVHQYQSTASNWKLTVGARGKVRGLGPQVQM